MNIFVLHEKPEIAATMACDKHVVKMILETAQMMCTVVASYGHETPYRATHAKHPCTIWAAQSRANWNWLVEHGMSLCDEYTKRYSNECAVTAYRAYYMGEKASFATWKTQTPNWWRENVV